MVHDSCLARWMESCDTKKQPDKVTTCEICKSPYQLSARIGWWNLLHLLGCDLTRFLEQRTGILPTINCFLTSLVVANIWIAGIYLGAVIVGVSVCSLIIGNALVSGNQLVTQRCASYWLFAHMLVIMCDYVGPDRRLTYDTWHIKPYTTAWDEHTWPGHGRKLAVLLQLATLVTAVQIHVAQGSQMISYWTCRQFMRQSVRFQDNRE